MIERASATDRTSAPRVEVDPFLQTEPLMAHVLDEFAQLQQMRPTPSDP